MLDWILNVDWRSLFYPETPLLEIFARGTVVYLAIFILLRVLMKREAGTVGIADLLVVVLLADAAQNAMAGDYHSITDGLLLVATIIFWSYLLDFLGYRFPKFQRLLRSPPLLLVQDGHLIRRNMRKEFITEEELCSMIREQGVEDITMVKRAYMEGDGQISVITVNQDQHKKKVSRV